ncbi:uncharacterized protein LOC116949265 isoform X1 [Petromyzon marinus]|uniref:Uncharacterized protein LOC116949265 n=1 Tax=Petromyzon marinus TaxID=7757 RepID=A0AAJ7TQL5_PETMA|nr:uncharacterized protein LOC116949265 [Petromyzon marinus]
MLKSPCLVIRESRRTESPVSPTSPGAVTRGGGGGTPSKRDPELFRRRGLNLQLLQLQQLQQLQQTSVRTGARGCGTPSRLHRSSPRNAAATRDQLRGSARGGDGGGGGVCANEDWDGGDDGDGGGDGGDGDAPVRLTLARLVRRVERVVREVSAVRCAVATMERVAGDRQLGPRAGPRTAPEAGLLRRDTEVTRRIREAHERAQEALLELSETQARVSEGRQLLESRLGEKERLSEQLRLAHDSLHDVNAQGGQGAWLIVISIFTLLVSMLLASMWPRIVRGGGVY